MNKILILLMVAVTMVACTGKSNVSEKGYSTIAKPAFQNVKHVKVTSKHLNEILTIDDWGVYDSCIVCKSSKSDTLFYKYNDDFSFLSSFGVIGQGPEEYISPVLVKHSSDLRVIDNGNLTYNNVPSDNVKHKLVDLKMVQPANYPVAYSDSLICSIGYTPNAIYLCLYNIYTQATVDSITFADEEREGRAIRHDFVYDLYDDNLVIAYTQSNSFSLYKISDKGFEKTYQQVKGTQSDAKEKVYYTDVCCSKNGFMLLSNAPIDLETQEGTSEIECYSWDVTPQEIIKLDIIGDRILKGVNDSSIWIHSPLSDDDVFKVSL